MKIANGVQLRAISTSKFKDIGVSFRFRNKLSEKEGAARSLLAMLLCDRCRKYDTKQKMSCRQDELYGMSLSAQSVGYGRSQVIEVRSRLLHPSYLPDGEQYLEDAFSFLEEALCYPLLREDIYAEAKKMLLARVERMQDDPSQLAISEGLKAAGRGTPLGISALGEPSSIKQLTLEDVQKAYKSMMEEDEIEIIVCGNIEEEKIYEYIKRHFPWKDRCMSHPSWYLVEKEEKERTESAYRRISQSYVMITWFTHTAITDHRYYALRLANALFGQYSVSLLFQEVREKRSLCYSIFSNLISYDGALGVTTGVEKKDIEEVLVLIDEQMERIKRGDFSDEQLEASRRMLINSIRAGGDHMNSLIALTYQNALLKREQSMEDMIEKIGKITREEIIAAMRRCEKKMTYILTAEEEQHEEDHE